MAAHCMLAGCSNPYFLHCQSRKQPTPPSCTRTPVQLLQSCLTYRCVQSSWPSRRLKALYHETKQVNVRARAEGRRREVKTAQPIGRESPVEARASVQPLDEEWEDWDSAALDGVGAQQGSRHLPGNAVVTSSDAAFESETEWESLTEEEEAALLLQLEDCPLIELLEVDELQQIEATFDEGEGWRSASDEEKRSIEEQLAAGKASPFRIERLLDDGESAPLDSSEAEGLGELWNEDASPYLIEKVLDDGKSAPLDSSEAENLGELWNDPGLLLIERLDQNDSEALQTEEMERLQQLWETAEEPATGGAETEPAEEWEDFDEEQLRRVQQQLDAFKAQFFEETSEDEESESEDDLREDLWQGDLEGAMTPEEEASLLREAERELAQGFGGEEEADAELVRKLNATSNFKAQRGAYETSDDEEGQLLKEAELELQSLNESKPHDESSEEWGEESTEDLTEDEVLVRVLNQQRSEELDVEEDEGSDSEANQDVWVGDLEGEMSPEEEAAILAEAERELAILQGEGESFGEGGAAALGEEEGVQEKEVRLKMVATLRDLVDEPLPKQQGKIKQKAARPDVEGRTENKQTEDGPMSKLEEARMLRRMEQELAELRKDDRAIEYDEEGREKKKIPNEMRCFDTAKIYVKAGDGGNGCVAFRREKFVAYGGPSGGNGGRGGHVFVEVDASMNSLQPFRKQIHFRAGRGGHGEGSKCEGHKGADITIKVPPGSVVKRAREPGEEEGEWLMELIKPGEKQLLIPGGRGGRGNTSFKSAQNKAPVIAEDGEEGKESWIELELKLVADVGIVGVPNAGKSTLLSVVSAARPKIANYPFTTLVPNLGVAEIDFESIVFADVPGLLEGAHTGHGLGQEFLRHCERSRVLVHVIDGTSPQPLYDYEAICAEMALFNPVLAQKPQIVAFNKMDVPEAQAAWPAFQEAMHARGVEAVAISAVAQENVQTILRRTQALLKEIANPYEYDPFEHAERRVKVVVPSSNKGPPIDVFDIEQDPHTRTWMVSGEGLERFTQMTNWEYYEAVKRFQKVLDSSEVNQELKRRGVREGDTVVVGEMEFSWIDKDDWNTFGDGWTRGTRGSKHWPH